tara:strand:+ start:2338 stop:2553 length:216 start_codon:yes stop_codon:yes gene_type:complete
MTEEKSKENAQKFSWKNHKTFKTYEEADTERKKCLENSDYVKVRRTGPQGSRFTVKIGTPVSKKGDKHATK